MNMIDLQNVSKIYYPGKIPAVALNDVSLQVKKGEFLVVAGSSGSGKSTLLNLIGLIDEPSSGSVIIDSLETEGSKEKILTKIRREYLGYIFQNFHLIPTLTVFENVERPLLSTVRDVYERRLLVEESLERVGLQDFLKRYPNEISGGQQQRVSIARAFAKNPEIVLADEPTANLDSANGASILELMEKMNVEKNVTFVLASHDPEVLSLSHRQILLKDGKIISDRTSVKEEPRINTDEHR
ncbi:MAG: ABC transporter ATP-binding protein [Spirochaetia bacterium]|nr:ABC transporter ATP-binding protein [Spirochaetia bacterium]